MEKMHEEIEELSKKLVEEIHSKKEEIVTAFIAKYGIDPSEAILKQRFNNETKTFECWIEKR